VSVRTVTLAGCPAALLALSSDEIEIRHLGRRVGDEAVVN
jgi:hypothetical protein